MNGFAAEARVLFYDTSRDRGVTSEKCVNIATVTPIYDNAISSVIPRVHMSL